MSDKNWYAIVGMLAIVVTLYALKSQHVSYLPDLFGLVLALAAPQQSYAIGAWAILAIIRHSGLAIAFADVVPDWLHAIVLPALQHMSIAAEEAEEAEYRYKERISLPDRNAGNMEKSQPVAENEQTIISTAKIEIIALAVITGAMSRTEAARILSGAQSGRKYQVAARKLKAEIARQQNHYYDLDEQHKRK